MSNASNTAWMTLSEYHANLAREVTGLTYPPGRRTQIALASLLIAHEHFRGISALLQRDNFASALVLARPLYEATVKGLWFHYCAEDDKLEAYAFGRELESMSELTAALLSKGPPIGIAEVIDRIKRRYWKLLSSFTHAGHAQVKRWFTATGVEPQYAQDEIQELIQFAGFMVLVATLEMARLAGDQRAIATLEGRLAAD